jgi:competence protein ComEC
MSNRHFGHRAPLLWLVLPFMGGLALADAGVRPPVAAALGVAGVAAGLALPAAGGSRRLWMTGLGLAMLGAGNASYTLHRHRLAGWDEWPPREARLSLLVERIFPSSDPRRITGVGTIVRTEGHLRELAGQRIYFSLALRPSQVSSGTIERSAVIAISGLLSVLPEHAPPGTFDGSLAALGLNFRLTRARWLAREGPPDSSPLFSGRLAGRMSAILSDGLDRHPELAEIYRAMMLGQKRDLSPAQREIFLHSGTMHLFAINGLHIGIVAVALHALLALLRCPRLPAGALVLAVLWLDVGATGSSPSAVRAFVMAAAMEAAWTLRRPSNLLSALAASALIVLLLDPMDFFSASFRMSYGVMTAIVTLGLPLAAWLGERFPPFRDLPEVTWSGCHHGLAWIKRHLLQAAGIGGAAALAGGVTGVQYFNLVVPAGLLANLLFLPPASLVIVAGFGSVLGGLAGVGGVSRLFNHAACVLLRGITACLGLVTRAPGAWFSAHYRADWVGPLALAALLASCLAGYGFRWRRARGGFWPPLAIVAATIAFGVRFG